MKLDKLAWPRRGQHKRPRGTNTPRKAAGTSAHDTRATEPASANWEAEDERDPLVRRAELIISQVLRWGVVLSAVIIAVGVVAFYVRYSSAAARTNHDQTYPHSPVTVLAGLAHGDPLAIIMLGLLVLLATPFMRVLVSIGAFALERDWIYVGITVTVLVILLISFFLGRGGA